jgi:hypothetical protein
LLVGARLFTSEWHGYFPGLGLLREVGNPNPETLEGDNQVCWTTAVGFRCGKCKRMSVYHESGSWRCRVSGCWDGDGYLGSPHDEFRDAWVSAGNMTQCRRFERVRIDWDNDQSAVGPKRWR